MNVEATLARPITAVFGPLADPARLGEWLPGITAAQAGAARPAGTGAGFSLRLRTGTGELAGTGELIAYQPPWSVAYRLQAGPHAHILQLTCTACGPGATEVRIRQRTAPVRKASTRAAPAVRPGTPAGQ